MEILRDEYFEKLVETYRPPDLSKQLGAKTMVAVVGPSSVGKTSLIQEIVSKNPDDFHAVQTLTTRPPTPRDNNGSMRYLPHNQEGFDQLLSKMEQGELVQAKVHDTTGYIYATELSDYPKPYNLLATLATEVHKFRRLPFGYVATIGVAAKPVTAWRPWLLDRYTHASNPSELSKRLTEARISLDWLLNDAETMWVENRPGEAALQYTANEIVRLVRGSDDKTSEARRVALQMHEFLPSLRPAGQQDAI
jgi:guanylate kinase